MVILSVSVCNKKGKILIARQYVSMTRLRIESLLAAFPKLVDADENASNKQHTFIETDDVRYVYQPMDTLYLLLITNMQSNILQDLSTLRMIAKLIPEYCGGHDEESVSQSAFELLFALDEVVSPLGYREQVNYSQIDDFVKMDSAEEKLVQIIELSKEQSQKQVAIDQAKMFDKRRREIAKQTKNGFGIRGLDQLSALSGLTSGYSLSSSARDNKRSLSSEDFENQTTTQGDVKITSHSDYGNSSGSGHNSSNRSNSSSNSSSSNNNSNSYGFSSVSSKKKSGPRKIGFELNPGKGQRKADDLFNAVLAQDKKTLKSSDPLSMISKRGFRATVEDEDLSDLPPVEVTISEHLEVSIFDDQIQRFLIKGMFEVVVNSPNANQCCLEIEKPGRGSIAGFPRNIPWKLHPRMDSALWTQQSILKLKNEKKTFRIGRSNKTAILKWNLSTKEDLKPIDITFWPEEQSGFISVNCNYQVLIEDCQLYNVILTFPCSSSSSDPPEIVNCDGDQTFDKRNKELQWVLGNLAEGDKGAIEYNVSDVSMEDLYPVNIHFEMKQNYCPIKVLRVLDAQEDEDEDTETAEELEFTTTHICVADKYSIKYAD